MDDKQQNFYKRLLINIRVKCLKQGVTKSEFCLKQGRKISDICLKQGQGMRGRAAPLHPGIYRVPPPPVFGVMLKDCGATFINHFLKFIAGGEQQLVVDESWRNCWRIWLLAGLQKQNKTMASTISNVGFSKLKSNSRPDLTPSNLGMFQPLWWRKSAEYFHPPSRLDGMLSPSQGYPQH